MNPYLIFKICNNVVLPGWLCLALFPQWQYTFLVARVGVLLNCVAYVYGFLFNRGPPAKGGSFFTLKGVTAILNQASPGMAMVAWGHYLAFDLLVGEFITRDALQSGISQWLVAPCLFFTLMLGPSGALLYHIIKAVITGQLM